MLLHLLVLNLRSYSCLCYAENWCCGLQGGYVYCLALFKSTNINVIGRKYLSMTILIICHFEILPLCIHSFIKRLSGTEKTFKVWMLYLTLLYLQLYWLWIMKLIKSNKVFEFSFSFLGEQYYIISRLMNVISWGE